MKKLCYLLFLSTFNLNAQKQVEWVSTTETSPWSIQKGVFTTPVSEKPDIEILPDKPLQTAGMDIIKFP